MALMQLVAYGAQDVYLTGITQMSFFRKMYNRHFNFVTDHIELDFDILPTFGNRSSITITRQADLLRKCYLKIILDNPNCELEGLDFIESVEIEIGGMIISRYEKDFLHIINSLYLTDEKKKMLNMLSKKGSNERIYH